MSVIRGESTAASLRRPLVALTLVCGTVASGQTPDEVKPRFPAATELVTVDVVVLDGHGVPLAGLTRGDFSLAEEGTPQEIAAFEAVDRPPAAPGPAGSPPLRRTSSNTDVDAREQRSFAVVFDELHLDLAEAKRGREAVAEFLKSGVGDRDRVTLVGTAEGTRWTARIPEGRDTLLQVLGRLQGRSVGEMVRDAITPYEAMRIDQDRDPLVTERVVRRFLATGEIRQETRLRGDAPDRGENLDTQRSLVQARAAQVYARTAAQSEVTLGILERTLASLTAVRGRKSLVLVSGGFAQDTRLPGFRRALTESRRANAALYFLDARGLGGAPSALRADSGTATAFNDIGSTLGEAREGSEGSEALAADTGGFTVRDTNDLVGGIERIGRESARYYLLGYSPTDRRADGRFRKIQVTVARQGVTVRARRGYFASGGKAEPVEPRDTAMQRALDSPFDLADVPLRATTHTFGEGDRGRIRVSVTVETDVRGLGFEERGGTSKDTLELLLVVAHRATGEFHRVDQQFEMSFRPETRARFQKTWFPVTREMPLEPGAYQARIVMRDKNSGRVGTVTHEFDVPRSGGLRLSTLVLSDRLHDDSAGARNPELIARRSFTPKGILHSRFEVYGAALDPATKAPDVTAGFSIRRADGRFLAAAPETALKAGPGGALVRTMGTPLEGVAPGRYELILLVTDRVAGQVAEAREPFEIEPPTP